MTTTLNNLSHTPGQLTAEQRYVLQQFGSIVTDPHLPVAIYGLSASTEIIVHHYPHYHIVGLLDAAREGERVYGYPVLSMDEAVASGVQTIVIVARNSNVRIIFRRIEQSCRQAGIAVYDLQGRDLTRLAEKNTYLDPYPSVSSDEVKAQIAQADSISFDIFDTLMTRRVLQPAHIFDLVAVQASARGYDCDRFAQQRSGAEGELNREIGSPTLEDIYQRLHRNTGWPQWLCQELQALELSCETQALIPRRAVVDLYDYALSLGKPVTLISDMYHSSATITGWLQRCGVRGPHTLLVSGDYGVSKCNGLFDVYLEGKNPSTCVHIGDNPDADDAAATQRGMSSVLIASPYALLDCSALDELLELATTPHTQLQVGMFASHVFNDPFIFHDTQGRLRLEHDSDIGTIFTAPIVTTFVHWLLERTQGQCERLYVAARDGFILQRLITDFIQGYQHRHRGEHHYPQPVYLLTSRACGVFASLVNPQRLEYAVSFPFQGSAEHLLAQRFHLDPQEISPREAGEEWVDYVQRHWPAIQARAQEAEKNYRTYLEDLGLTKEDTIAFCDFVSAGTSQLALEDVLGRSIQGFFFVRLASDFPPKKGLAVQSLFTSGNHYVSTSHLLDNYMFVENVLSSDQPTLVGFSSGGEPVFGPETRTPDQIASLRDIHDAITDYARTFHELLGYTPWHNPDPSVADRLLKFLHRDYTVVTNPHILADKKLYDEFCGRDFSWLECTGLECPAAPAEEAMP